MSQEHDCTKLETANLLSRICIYDDVCCSAPGVLVDANICSLCVGEKPVVAKVALGFSKPVFHVGMAATCNFLI